MRKHLFLTLGLLLALVPQLRAADDDPQAIIDRAIKAFGADKLRSAPVGLTTEA